MRIFVAGATGAVGRLLVPLLLKAGHEVTGASRTAEGTELVRCMGASAVRADVLDADAVRRAVADAAPDAVIHQLTDLAGADGRANIRLRREGTRNLVDAARAAGVRRIVAQSVAWAYAPGGTPADESVPLDDSPEAPRASMVGGIRALEETVAELGTAVVLRYGILYGPGTWYAPGGAVAAALRGEPAAFLGGIEANDAVSSFVHVADAASAAVAALDWPSGPVNVVDDEPARGREWLPVLAGALGVPAPEPVPGGGEPWERGALNSRARELGWTPEYPTWREGFAGQGI
ncbi:NAD-dependent epimerase/dehydratase family protein [Streptomyces luteireticuli]|uniref:NAD-dependent epimerase/dehydratase family protein n=1 Tax=Streptomyces luteireticuli TaxID=173858 RepID=UPI003556207C